MGGSFDPIQASPAHFQGFHCNIFDVGRGGVGVLTLTILTSNLKFFHLFLAIFMLIPDGNSKLLNFKQYSNPKYSICTASIQHVHQYTFSYRDACTNRSHSHLVQNT